MPPTTSQPHNPIEEQMVTAVTPKSNSRPNGKPNTHSRQGKDTVANADHLDDQLAHDLVQLFKLLSDETRLRILYFLMNEEEINVRTLCELLQQSQPAVSHHLALLRGAGLIQARRDGKHNFYRIMPQRVHEMLAMIFAAAPEHDNSIRVNDFELTYTHVDSDRR